MLWSPSLRSAISKVVFALAVLAGLVAAGLAVSGTQNALVAVCALNGVILPTATLLVLAEFFIIRRGKLGENKMLPAVGNSAIIAWAAGMLVGIITSGIIPGTKALNVGVPILEAWMLALVLYILLRKYEIAATKVEKSSSGSSQPGSRNRPFVSAVD
jgi:hypothetical protein